MGNKNKKILVSVITIMAFFVIIFFGVKLVASAKAAKQETAIINKIKELTDIEANKYDISDSTFALLSTLVENQKEYLAQKSHDLRITESYEKAILSLRKVYLSQYDLDESFSNPISNGAKTEVEVRDYFSSNRKKIAFLSETDNYKVLYNEDIHENIEERMENLSKALSKEHEEEVVQELIAMIAAEKAAADKVVADAKQAAEDAEKAANANKPSTGGSTSDKHTTNSGEETSGGNQPVNKCGSDRPWPNPSIVGWRAGIDENGNEIPGTRSSVDECGWIRDSKGEIYADYYKDGFGNELE